MLHEFLKDNREEILGRARAKVVARIAPRVTAEELEMGIPLFLDQLIESLRVDPNDNVTLKSGATRHGEQRLQMGFTVAQVVHDYGNVCQVVTQLAIELDAPISTEEFRNLNRCLDDAIAQAVTEHARGREIAISTQDSERLAFLGHELRNLINTASLSYDILKDGSVAIGGSTGAVLGRSLSGLRDLVDRTLVEVRLDAGVDHRERLEVSEFLAEVELAGMIEAKTRGVTFLSANGVAGVVVDADRQLLASALGNLLQNAFKYTHAHGTVWLRTHATQDRVSIEIEDQCGGLPPAMTDRLFGLFQQHSADRSGLGLGLVISKRAVEAMNGELRAHNHPGTGCVFTVTLPRLPANAA